MRMRAQVREVQRSVGKSERGGEFERVFVKLLDLETKGDPIRVKLVGLTSIGAPLPFDEGDSIEVNGIEFVKVSFRQQSMEWFQASVSQCRRIEATT